MLIYSPARSQALARIWMILCLLNTAVCSELTRGRGLHLLSVGVRSELARATKGRTSLIRSQGDRRLHILGTVSSGKGLHRQFMYSGTSNKYRRRYMNVLIRGVFFFFLKFNVFLQPCGF